MNKVILFSGMLLAAGTAALEAAAGTTMRRLTQTYGQMAPRFTQSPRQSVSPMQRQPLVFSGQGRLRDVSTKGLLTGFPVSASARAFTCPAGMQQRLMTTAPSWWSNPLTYSARKVAYEQELKRKELTDTIFGDRASIDKRDFKAAISAPGNAQRVARLMEANPAITPEAVASVFATASDVHDLLQSKEGVALVDMLSAKNPAILIDMLRRMRGGAPNEMFGSTVIDSYGTLIADIIRFNGDAFAQLLKHNPEAAQEIAPGVKDIMLRVHSWGLPSANFMHMLKQNNADVLPLIAADIDESTADRIINRARSQAHYFLATILANPESEKILAQKLDVSTLKKRLHDLYVSTAPSALDLSDFAGSVDFFYKSNPYLPFNYHVNYRAALEKNSSTTGKDEELERIAPGSSPEQINMAYDMLAYRFNPERYVNEREKQKAALMLEQLAIARDAAIRAEPIDEALMQRLAESR